MQLAFLKKRELDAELKRGTDVRDRGLTCGASVPTRIQLNSCFAKPVPASRLLKFQELTLRKIGHYGGGLYRDLQFLRRARSRLRRIVAGLIIPRPAGIA